MSLQSYPISLEKRQSLTLTTIIFTYVHLLTSLHWNLISIVFFKASLGCAIANLEVAAHANGYETAIDATYPNLGTRVYLKESIRFFDQDLFRAIPERQVSRNLYNGNAVTKSELEQLQASGTGRGVRLILVTERSLMNQVLEHILIANTKQMQNPKFMDELRSWVRFNQQDAANKGDGLYGVCMGNPQAPKILGHLVFKLVARASIENKKIIKQVNSSCGFAIFVSEKDDATHWIEAGRCYERFALRTTALGIRNAFLNQPVEESEVRRSFSKLLSLRGGERPDLVVRFGKGTTMPPSPRRPVEEVIVDDSV